MISDKTPFIVVLRGPPGAGKTTLAKEVQGSSRHRVATIDTDMFNWDTVPGESNKQVVYSNVFLLTRNYLLYGYSVVVSGLILSQEEAGAIQMLRSLASMHNFVFIDFYCDASIELCKKRNAERNKDISGEFIEHWWSVAENDYRTVADIRILNMDLPLSKNVDSILEEIQRFHREAPVQYSGV